MKQFTSTFAMTAERGEDRCAVVLSHPQVAMRRCHRNQPPEKGILSSDEPNDSSPTDCLNMDHLNLPPGVREVMQKFFTPEFDVCLGDTERYINTLNLIKDDTGEAHFGHLLESLLRMTKDECLSSSLEQAFKNDEMLRSLDSSHAESLLNTMRQFKSRRDHPLRAMPIRKGRSRLLESGAIGNQPMTAQTAVVELTSKLTGDGECTREGKPHHIVQMNVRPKLLDTDQGRRQPSVSRSSSYGELNHLAERPSCQDSLPAIGINVSNEGKRTVGVDKSHLGSVSSKNPGPNCIVVGVQAVRRNRFILPKPCETDLCTSTDHGGKTELEESSEKEGEEKVVRGREEKKRRRAKRAGIDVLGLCGGERKGKTTTSKRGKKRKKARKKPHHTEKSTSSSTDLHSQGGGTNLISASGMDGSVEGAGVHVVGESDLPNVGGVVSKCLVRFQPERVNDGSYDDGDNLSDILIVDEDSNLPETKAAFDENIRAHAAPHFPYAGSHPPPANVSTQKNTETTIDDISNHAVTGNAPTNNQPSSYASAAPNDKKTEDRQGKLAGTEEGVETHVSKDDGDDSCSCEDCWKEDCLSMSSEKQDSQDIQCISEDISSLAMHGVKSPAALWKLYDDYHDGISGAVPQRLNPQPPIEAPEAGLAGNRPPSADGAGRGNGTCTNRLPLTAEADTSRQNCENCYPQCATREVTGSQPSHGKPLMGSHILITGGPEQPTEDVDATILGLEGTPSPSHRLSQPSDGTPHRDIQFGDPRDQGNLPGLYHGEQTHDVKETSLLAGQATRLMSYMNSANRRSYSQNIEVGIVHNDSDQHMPMLEPAILGVSHGTVSTHGSEGNESGCNFTGSSSSFLSRLLEVHNSSDSEGDLEDVGATAEVLRRKPVVKKPRVRRSRRNRRAKEV